MKKLKYLYSKVVRKVQVASVVNCEIHVTSKIEAQSSVVDSSFRKHSFCGYNCQLISCDVGAFASISNNVVVGGGVHPIAWASMSPAFYSGKDSISKKFSEFDRPSIIRTTIGSDVWIGEGVLIKQGIKIGNGAVVGMGSVVTKDVPDCAVVAGNPANYIRSRFEKAIVELYCQSEWWDLTDSQLENIASDIRDPKIFLERAAKMKVR